MAEKFFCAHCDLEFVPDEPADKPRCPRCMRRGGVDPVEEAEPQTASSRKWLLAVALLALAAGLGFGVYRMSRVALEDAPPHRPLGESELRAYLGRDQVDPGSFLAMFRVEGTAKDWPASPVELATRLHAETSRWSLEHPLPRKARVADELLTAFRESDARVTAYPLEMATTMTALLRSHGIKAMVAEAWEIEGAEAPADPSGLLGYFVTAVYESDAAGEPSTFFDPWGGRGAIELDSVRVLRDTEVVAAAIGTESIRIFARSGDGTRAMPLSESALLVDRLSPTLRGVHATVLLESGGVDQAVKELEAAEQLRSDGPRKLAMVQLHLAQASVLQMNGEPEGADAELNRASALVGEVIERWPRYGRAHVLMASLYLGAEALERARVELEEAEALSPDSPLMHSIWAQYLLATSEPAGAAVRMKRAVRLDPDNWQLRLQAARVLQGVDDDEGARENLSAVMKMVSPGKRADIQRFVERMMGPEALSGAPVEPEEAPDAMPPELDDKAADEPALMLGDPSKLRLRDPNDGLKLQLEE